ncbi:MAG: MotA/TolQ/ExbB proton channel family protein [Candidatus Omnitrophota bacterium]
MDIRWYLSFKMTGWFCGGLLIVLALLSIISWSLIFRKMADFRRARRANARFRSMAETEIPGEYAGFLASSSFYLIFHRVNKFPVGNERDLERLEEEIKVELNEYFENLNSGLPILGSITGVAPFIGLLGTVWGIMVIFSRMYSQVAGVSEMVAPGVAQALITTIAGLIVAIPALFFYNYFVMISRSLSGEAENYASRLISRK